MTIGHGCFFNNKMRHGSFFIFGACVCAVGY